MTIDATRDYLQAIGRHPLLTLTQEIELSRKVARYMQLRDLEGERTKQEQRDIKVGLKARDTIVNCNLRLVVHIAKRYTRRVDNFELLDLIQEGSLGLQRAAELFDASRGYKFSTYAYWWIRQSIQRAIDTKEKIIRIPQYLIDRANKALRIEDKFMQEHGRTPSKKELAELLDISVDQLLAIVNFKAKIASLDQCVTDDGNLLVELIASPIEQDTEMDHDKEELELAFFYLNDIERDILNKRYGLNGESEPLVLSKIADDYGLSRERIRQRVDTAKNKLKLMMSVYEFPPRAS
jgi:RNA polymerase sigma factor (sigma-70 family)